MIKDKDKMRPGKKLKEDIKNKKREDDRYEKLFRRRKQTVSYSGSKRRSGTLRYFTGRPETLQKDRTVF